MTATETSVTRNADQVLDPPLIDEAVLEPPVPHDAVPPGSDGPTLRARMARWSWVGATVVLAAVVVVGTKVLLDSTALLVLLGPRWPSVRFPFGAVPVVPTLLVSLAITSGAAFTAAATARRAGLFAVRRRARARGRTPRP